MSKEEDIDRLVNVLQSTKSIMFTKLAQEIIDVGFSYIGDTETKQLAHSGELTRKWLFDEAGKFYRNEQTSGPMIEAILDRHRQAVVATEARVRGDLERDVDNWKFHFKASERDRASLRTTIADLEKRLENTVEIDWSKAPEWAVNWQGVWLGDGMKIADACPAIPRPAPVKLTPEQMAEAWVQWRMKNYIIPGGESGELREGAYVALAEFLMAGKTIEELYNEVING